MTKPKKSAVTPPDFTDAARLHMGGDISVLDTPRVYMYPGPVKRRVTCDIRSFIGLSPGAVHYYAHIRECDNYAWSSQEHAWVQPWGTDLDPAFAGKDVETKFLTVEDALCWCRCVARELFAMATHDVEFELRGDADCDIPVFFWREKERKPEPWVDPRISEVGYYHKD